MPQSLLHVCRQLAASWLSVDRIRIAPTTGRLLQLKVGQRIILLNQLYSVRQRRVESCSGGHDVIYLLGQSEMNCELRVHRRPAMDENCGQLATAAGIQTVFDSDVSVLQP